MVDPMPSFSVGQLYRRTTIHKQFGGQEQGGISTPARAPFVMIVTGDSGLRYGYLDQWTDDGLFSYTGEGRRGDMAMKGGNRAIRNHKEYGKSLFLFEQDKNDKRFLRFLGEMEYVSHSFRDAPDEDQKIRKAIVFQLRPVGSMRPDSAIISAALADEVTTSATPRGGGFGSVETNRKVEKAAIDFVRNHYESDGWTVVSVEANKVGYDLRCQKGNALQHIEVKGTQGSEVLFIITAAEVRNVMLDRHHVTCIVTAALSPEPRMFTYTKDEFVTAIDLDPIAYRAKLRI